MAVACNASDTTIRLNGDVGSGGTEPIGVAHGGDGGSGGVVLVDPASSSGGGGEAPNCGGIDLEANIVPANVMVVVDQSKSMGKAWGEGPELKWQVARASVEGAVQPIENLLRVGAIFFPTWKPWFQQMGGACDEAVVSPMGEYPQIDTVPGPDFLEAWTEHYESPTWQPIVGTPLAPALQAADIALQDPSPAEGVPVVVLLSDGAPTCDVDTALMTSPVEDMWSRGIKTYVIGFPGTGDGAALLDAIALAGGTTAAMSPADGSALQTVLAEIAQSALDCVFTFGSPPPELDDVHAIVVDAADGTIHELAQGTAWQLSDDGKTATLLGDACADAKNGSYSSVKFVFGCPEDYLR